MIIEKTARVWISAQVLPHIPNEQQKSKARPERKQYDNSYFRYASNEVLYDDLYIDVSKKDIFLSPDSYRPKTNCFNCVV